MKKIFVFVLLLGAATEAWAQQTPDLDHIIEQLAAEKDATVLRRREFSLGPASARSNDALLERGLVFMRLHQISGDANDAKQARSLIERASKKAPTDPRIFYAMGLARIGGPGVRVPLLSGVVTGQAFAEVIKRDPVSLAKRDFKKALELDPNYSSAAIELARVSLESRDRENMEAAAVALRAQVASGRGGTRGAVMLSELEEGLGNVQAAVTAADVATTISVGSSTASSAEHARGVALLRQPEKIEEGARAYWSGVDNLTSETAQTYYDGVESIASAREKQQWAELDLNGRIAWLHRFWKLRAASGGVTVAERMAEHFSRLSVAHDKYRKHGKRGATPAGSLVANTYKKDDLPFDDRGVIYVRHGEPFEIVRTTDVNLRPNETWVYRSNGKSILYNFVKLRDGTDFRLVDDLLAALDPSTLNTPTEAAAKLLRDRQAYEPRYASMAQQYDRMDRSVRGFNASGDAASEAMRGMSSSAARVSADMREEAFRGLVTDTHTPEFTGDLPFWYDLYSFRGRNGLTDITAAAAIPGTSLFSQPRGSQYIYSIQASLIFIDTVTSEITRKDSIFTFLSSRVLGPNEHLRMTVDMTVPFSKTGMHRIVLRDRINPGVGQLYGGDSDIKNFNAGVALMMSDVVLAESEDGAWTRGDARLGLVPPRQFMEKKPLKVFYEIYNLPAGAPYRTEVSLTPVEGVTGFGRIRKLLGGGDGKIQLQFDGAAPADSEGTIQELKQVSAEVKPGKYKVIVRITNLENQQSVNSETMFIVGGKDAK